jgi:phytoene synthase
MDAFEHCERLVRVADKDRFLATLFAPKPHRPALLALYAFNVEVARVREQVREPVAGQVRLQWWSDMLAGAGHGDVTAHPVAAALLATIERYRLPVRSLTDLVEARHFDVGDAPMAAIGDLEDYAEKTSSALIALAAQILNKGTDPAIGKLAFEAGIAYAMAGLLTAFPLHAGRRQLYMPMSVMDRHHARREDVFTGQATTQVRAALAEMRLHARRHLNASIPLIAALPPALVPAVLPVALVRPRLARMERRNYDPFKPGDVPQWRRQWALWRAARRPAQIAG